MENVQAYNAPPWGSVPAVNTSIGDFLALLKTEYDPTSSVTLNEYNKFVQLIHGGDDLDYSGPLPPDEFFRVRVRVSALLRNLPDDSQFVPTPGGSPAADRVRLHFTIGPHSHQSWAARRRGAQIFLICRVTPQPGGHNGTVAFEIRDGNNQVIPWDWMSGSLRYVSWVSEPPINLFSSAMAKRDLDTYKRLHFHNTRCAIAAGRRRVIAYLQGVEWDDEKQEHEENALMGNLVPLVYCRFATLATGYQHPGATAAWGRLRGLATWDVPALFDRYRNYR